MASSRERVVRIGAGLATLMVLMVSGCSNGVGEGQVTATITVEDCGLDASSYTLDPTFFAADSIEDYVEIRVQRGSDFEIASDGIGIGVEDASLVEATMLGMPLVFEPTVPHVPATTPVQMSLYLNDTCPFETMRQPVVLMAVSGSITFDSLWVPGSDDRHIVATMNNVRLEDPNEPAERFAILDGDFDFYYTRGQPAQRYP